MPKKATELEYLTWFFQECDFGPAHEDVIYCMNQAFVVDTGKQLPDNYNPDMEEELLEAEIKKEMG